MLLSTILTGTLHQYHSIRLLQILFRNAIIARNRRIREDLVEWITASGTTLIHSSSIVKHHEFDDQRRRFYKRSLHFGIKNLKQYLKMNTYSR